MLIQLKYKPRKHKLGKEGKACLVRILHWYAYGEDSLFSFSLCLQLFCSVAPPALSPLWKGLCKRGSIERQIGNSPISLPPHPHKSPSCWARKSVKSVKTQPNSQVAQAALSAHTHSHTRCFLKSQGQSGKGNTEYEIQYGGEPIERRAARTQQFNCKVAVVCWEWSQLNTPSCCFTVEQLNGKDNFFTPVSVVVACSSIDKRLHL